MSEVTARAEQTLRYVNAYFISFFMYVVLRTTQCTQLTTSPFYYRVLTVESPCAACVGVCRELETVTSPCGTVTPTQSQGIS